jgi:hypothetical protein
MTRGLSQCSSDPPCEYRGSISIIPLPLPSKLFPNNLPSFYYSTLPTASINNPPPTPNIAPPPFKVSVELLRLKYVAHGLTGQKAWPPRNLYECGDEQNSLWQELNLARRDPRLEMISLLNSNRTTQQWVRGQLSHDISKPCNAASSTNPQGSYGAADCDAVYFGT